MYQTIAHNGTVTIADPPQSIFDPQAWFLYIILASALGGVAYFVYSTYVPNILLLSPPGAPGLCLVVYNSWIKTVMPKKKTPRQKDVRRREAPVATSGASNYEEWIPQHHLKKDTPAKKRKGAKVSSPGNLSS